MKYHALFVIFEKSSKIINCHLLQNIGCALRVKVPTNNSANSMLEINTILEHKIANIFLSINSLHAG